MKSWSKYPVIYEINTWVWLGDLSRKYQRQLDLSSVPEQEWVAIAEQGFDAIWFMGVWERSPAGIAISMRNPGLLKDFQRALADFSAADNVGSPYCVRRYRVAEQLGGPQGLAVARAQLAASGIRLILDFVPNHVAPDHPWVTEHPEYMVTGHADEAQRDPAAFIEADGQIFACGRDPYFPAWPDVLQVNAFSAGLRQAAIETVADIADQCDGIRCDMAMLMLNEVFERTWGARVGAKPSEDYWRILIPAIKSQRPEFKFIAEAYWDLEWQLQQQGFDFCYDKKLYDRMEHGAAETVRQHLLADTAYQQRMVRFIENHDEPRATQAFPSLQGRAAALAVLTLPGARLLHEGQFQGMRVRLPVFLSRRPVEPVNLDLLAFYSRLLKQTHREVFRSGEWRLCERRGWPDNQSFQQILTWSWSKGDERYLVVINYADRAAQAGIHGPWYELHGDHCRLDDVLSGESYERNADELFQQGLYVDLKPWQFHLFHLQCK